MALVMQGGQKMTSNVIEKIYLLIFNKVSRRKDFAFGGVSFSSRTLGCSGVIL